MYYSLSALNIYPIKSIRGIALQTSQVEPSGLWGDRRFMLVKADGECVTGRKHPALTLLKAEHLEDGKWRLSHPTMANQLIINPNHFSNDYKDVMAMSAQVSAQVCFHEANSWLSQAINDDIQLVYFGEKSARFTKKRPDAPVAFADNYPFLLTTEASLAELNDTCSEAIEMAQFRPNLVIQGNKPFAEDRWKRIKIGEIEFENIQPCERCIFTTLNPTTAQRSKKGEPLKTLGKFRLLDKNIHFGIHLVALNTGIINVGDPVDILEHQGADEYLDRR